MEQGTKNDAGKPDLTLIPYAAHVVEAQAMMYGQEVYGRYNFMQGFAACRLAAAAIRHILKWVWVSTFDEDSGIHHLGHARANLGMILGLEAEGRLVDDRYVATKEKQ